LPEKFKNGSSLLFVLVRKVTPNKVLTEFQGTGGKVIKTSLIHEQEEAAGGVTVNTAKGSAAAG
jgi:uncharacterized membrane protein